MLIDALDAVRAAGADARLVAESRNGPVAHPDEIVEVTLNGVSARFVVETRRRAPYPGEVNQVLFYLSGQASLGRPMLVVPYVSEPLGELLTSLDISWADSAGNVGLTAPGLAISRRVQSPPPKRSSRDSLPQGSGSLGIIRSLIAFNPHADEEPGATGLAAQAGVTQPRASQVLHRLLDLGLVERSGSGRWKPDREALLDRFISDYRGPGGSERALYSLDEPSHVARRVSDLSSALGRVGVSADVGPDLLVPWRKPTALILYSAREIEPRSLGAVAAESRDHANVFVRVPVDRSVFPTHRLTAQLDGRDLELADGTQLLWDLLQLGGEDRRETAERLQSWLLRH